MKCTKCDLEAEYDVPELLCEEHWARWFAGVDDPDFENTMTPDERIEYKDEILNDLAFFKAFDPNDPSTYCYSLCWYQKDGDEFIDQSDLNNLTAQQVTDLFGLKNAQKAHTCWEVTESHKAELKKFTRKKIDLDKYEYYVECFQPDKGAKWWSIFFVPFMWLFGLAHIMACFWLTVFVGSEKRRKKIYEYYYDPFDKGAKS